MKIQLRKLSEIQPYSSNPRRNDRAVEAVARSLKEFGFRQVPPEGGSTEDRHTEREGAQEEEGAQNRIDQTNNETNRTAFAGARVIRHADSINDQETGDPQTPPTGGRVVA